MLKWCSNRIRSGVFYGIKLQNKSSIYNTKRHRERKVRFFASPAETGGAVVQIYAIIGNRLSAKGVVDQPDLYLEKGR